MLWRVMPFEVLGQAARFLRFKRLIERSGLVRVQIVLDEHDLFGVREHFVAPAAGVCSIKSKHAVTRGVFQISSAIWKMAQSKTQGNAARSDGSEGAAYRSRYGRSISPIVAATLCIGAPKYPWAPAQMPQQPA